MRVTAYFSSIFHLRYSAENNQILYFAEISTSKGISESYGLFFHIKFGNYVRYSAEYKFRILYFAE